MTKPPTEHRHDLTPDDDVAESLGTFLAAWDARAPRPRTYEDYVRLARSVITTFGVDDPDSRQ
jgi:hypothetical protein